MDELAEESMLAAVGKMMEMARDGGATVFIPPRFAFMEIKLYGEEREADSEAELYRKIVGRDSAVIGKRKR